MMKKQTKAARRPHVLGEALRAMAHHHSTMAICTYLAEHLATAFRGTETRRPTKLLRMPDGGAHVAAPADVLLIERSLHEMAAKARASLLRLQSMSVTATPADLDVLDEPEWPADFDPVAHVVDEKGASSVRRRA